MLTFQFLLLLLLEIISTEKALTDYALDAGEPPSWMNAAEREKAVVDRWYVDIMTATCKPFKYKGSLGNFNNFVSKAVCQYHLTFTPEEKSNACAQPKSDGICKVPDEKKKQRWYFSKGAVDGGTAVNSCHEFKYTGCGGNANNFESEIECKNACQNKKNGKVDESFDDGKLTPTPNKFDCGFAAEVDNATPKMGVVLHKNKKRCVYAAVGENAQRGYFEELPKCVETCITEPVAACDSTVPYQVIPNTKITNNNQVIDYFYFHKERKACLPFVSQTPEAPIQINDGSHNIFSSAELCASFCPATAHLGDLNAVEACKQEKVGESTTDDKYELPRHYYDTTGATPNTCKPFNFNGKEMNLNNFKSETACNNICTEPLKTVSVQSTQPVVNGVTGHVVTSGVGSQTVVEHSGAAATGQTSPGIDQQGGVVQS